MTHLSDCLELARRHNLTQDVIGIEASLADLHIRQRAWDKAAELLTDAERLAQSPGMNAQPQLPEIWRAWAQVHLAWGNLDQGLDFAKRSVNRAHRLKSWIEKGVSQRILGLVQFHANKPNLARQAWKSSLELLENQDIYEAARIKALWGRAQPSDSDAERMIHEARRTFTDLGAKQDLLELDNDELD
jgi:tetratricopeptide (TPR) repeat protein